MSTLLCTYRVNLICVGDDMSAQNASRQFQDERRRRRSQAPIDFLYRVALDNNVTEDHSTNLLRILDWYRTDLAMEDAVLSPPPVSIPIVVEPNLTLFTHYSVEFQQHEVTCDLCGTDIALTAGEHPARFLQHRNKINCRKKGRRHALDQDQARAVKIRETIGTAAVQDPSGLATSLASALMPHRQPPTSATTTPTATTAVSAPDAKIPAVLAYFKGRGARDGYCRRTDR